MITSEYRTLGGNTLLSFANGAERSLCLIDTGLGICNISEIVRELTDLAGRPVTAVAA